MPRKLSQELLQTRYQWMYEFFTLNKRAPTLYEISSGWGIGPTAAKNTLRKLADLGWLSLRPGKGGIRILATVSEST